MKKAVVYPFDKIARGLVKFRDELDFQISAVIDFVFNIGEDAGENADGEYAGIPITDDTEKALDGIDILIINSIGKPLRSRSRLALHQSRPIELRSRKVGSAH